MKSTLAFSVLVAAVLLGASENSYEISAMAGYTIPNDGQFLDDYGTYGAEIEFNGVDLALKPELSFFYGEGDYKYDNGDTKIYRTGLNGVYEFEKGFNTTPFLKIGGGYESMSNSAFGNHDGFFADAGVGVKMELTPQVAFKLEAIEMVKFNGGSHENNLALFGGLTFYFDQKGAEHVTTNSAVEPLPVIAPAVVAEKRVETVVVADPVKESVVVAAPQDSDNDGILDPNDRCPNTAEGLTVDEYGCLLASTFNDHFIFNSDHIDSTAASEIRAFVVFMNENPRYKATITGHTDSIGTPKVNQIVSEKRANKVKEALISQGIAPERLSTVGKGESLPIVSNMLKAGRAENRRVEIDIHE